MNKEQIYDTEISPLMTQILEVCKANKIAMLASFHIPTEEDETLACSSALLEKDFNPPSQFLNALNIIRASEKNPVMLTTRDAAGNVIRMETIL